MQDGTLVGLEPHARPEAPTPNISDDPARCACGRPVDGYDARRGEPTCARCAELRADGAGQCGHSNHFVCSTCSDETGERKPPAARAFEDRHISPRPTFVETTDGEVYDVDYAEKLDDYLRCVNFATDAGDEVVGVVDFTHHSVRAVQRYSAELDGGDGDE